jgi:hypothetical protein
MMNKTTLLALFVMPFGVKATELRSVSYSPETTPATDAICLFYIINFRTASYNINEMYYERKSLCSIRKKVNKKGLRQIQNNELII